MADRQSPLVGLQLASHRFPVEAGKVREFALATRNADPIHQDARVARSAGLPGVVAPLTFSVASAWWAPPEAANALDLDLRRVLAGGAEWEYRRPVQVGEVLEVNSSVVAVEHKEGRRGGMTVITRETTFRDDKDELVVAVRSQVIELDDVPGGGSDES